MGADIHLFIEYQDPEYKDYWSSFGGQINPGRNYSIFALMAGVRNYDNFDLFSPKGLPDKIGYKAKSANELYVSDDENYESEDSTTRSSADRWVESGSSKYTNEKKNFVTHPDWHSHSWLTPEEYNKVLEVYEGKFKDYKVPVEYKAVQKILETFISEGYNARLVFWFDN